MFLQPFGRTAGADLVQFRPDDAADAVEFVAADAAAVSNTCWPCASSGAAGMSVGSVAFGRRRTGCISSAASGWSQCGDVAVGGLAGRGAALALMADGAAEFLEGVLVVDWDGRPAAAGSRRSWGPPPRDGRSCSGPRD